MLTKDDLWDVLRDYPAARVRLEAIAVKRLQKYQKPPVLDAKDDRKAAATKGWILTYAKPLSLNFSEHWSTVISIKKSLKFTHQPSFDKISVLTRFTKLKKSQYLNMLLSQSTIFNSIKLFTNTVNKSFRKNNGFPVMGAPK
mgnify:CR=1 FL=1